MRPVRKKRNEGFTLVELIVVVAILGFLLSIAIPRYLTARETAAFNASKANLHNLASLMELYATEKGSYPKVTNNAIENTAINWLKGHLAKSPKTPKTGSNYKYQGDANGSSYTIYDPDEYTVDGSTTYIKVSSGAIIEATPSPPPTSGLVNLDWQ